MSGALAEPSSGNKTHSERQRLLGRWELAGASANNDIVVYPAEEGRKKWFCKKQRRVDLAR
jgi:hypothetical protein